MPKKTKQVNQSTQPIEPSAKLAEQEPTTQPVDQLATPLITKDDYLKARATIKQYRESKKNQPKRKCSEAQLAALAAGRNKNKRFNKTTGEN